MVSRVNPELQERLRRAEEAETTVQRIGSLAAEAPALRVELARAHRQQAWDRSRKNAVEEAKDRMSVAYDKQANVPQMLEEIATMVFSLYNLFKDIDGCRRSASEYMSIVDRVDYEEELTKAEAEQSEIGRDTSSVEYVVASRHGPGRVRKMLESAYPDFDFLKDCDLGDPMHRDIALFILSHVISPEEIKTLPSQREIPE